MSLYDYKESQQLMRGDPGFYALVMAAMRKADSDNAEKLQRAFPATWEELQERYNSPGGELESDRDETVLDLLYEPNADDDATAVKDDDAGRVIDLMAELKKALGE